MRYIRIMKETTVTVTHTVQQRLAYAWAVADSQYFRLPSVNDRVLARCWESARQLTEQEALDLLADVPALVLN
jgi:hypothetical protein